MISKYLILAIFMVTVVSGASAARKYWYRNDNPLLQPHLLIPYTFNKDTDQLEYNKELYGSKPKSWVNNRNYLKQIADELQTIVWKNVLQNVINKNLKPDSADAPGSTVQATIQ